MLQIKNLNNSEFLCFIIKEINYIFYFVKVIVENKLR